MRSKGKPTITPSLRRELQTPLGKLIKGRLLPEAIGARGIVIAVGDVSTLRLAYAGRQAATSVYDYKYRRRPVPAVWKRRLDSLPGAEFRAKNRPGTVSQQAAQAVRKALRLAAKGKTTKVVVDGEEDLLALPAIVWAPAGSMVLYGQPSVGIVAVGVTAEAKQRARGLYKRISGR